ncbi:MAG: hypothetical protein ACKVKR_05095 [Pseudomonadales bacterium]|jgi:hypothetical protein
MITRNHLDWFRLKCPYPVESKDYKTAYRKLNGATSTDLEKLRAEFDEYDDGSIPVSHYRMSGEWFTTTGDPAEAVNMKGIQLHGSRYRVQKRINGTLRKWSFNTLSEALSKRDAIFPKVSTE